MTTKCDFRFTHAEPHTIEYHDADEHFVNILFTCVKCGNQRTKRIPIMKNINCEVEG